MNFWKYLGVLVLTVTLTGVIVPQNKKPGVPVIETAKKSHPVDGSVFLKKHYDEVAKYLSENPAGAVEKQLRKMAWNFTVGSTKSFWAYNYSSQQDYQVPSTCRAINEHSYIFVEDSVWGTGVNQAAIDSISNAFELRTPANASKGIYQMELDSFGNPPDVDSDPRIIILILDIQDAYWGNGGYVAGYFDPINEYSMPNSNQAEVYYIDSYPTNLKSASGLRIAMGTTAHEFQHMINWNYHRKNPEISFINEGLSQAATDICGYPLDFDSYPSDVNKYLFGWGATNDIINDYSRTARFFVYLEDQFGVGLFRYVAQDSILGVEGLKHALTSYGITKSLDDIFFDWCVANSINSTATNPAYGYRDSTISKIEGSNVVFPIVNSTIPLLYNYGVYYLNYNFGSNLKITFNSGGNSPNLRIKAVERNDSSFRILDVPLGEQFAEPLFGSLYKSIQFIISNADLNNYTNCSYSSTADVSGEAEYKWDSGNPDGYYQLSANDTLCVVFDSFPDGVLDSIRVALRKPGSITGGVWQFSGQPYISPLGAPLAAPITASISTESAQPYPVPYQNWATVDLRQYAISTNNPFAVGFVIGNASEYPGVMMAYYPSSSPHSYTYFQASDNVGTTGGWYSLTSDSYTGYSTYFIRAYIHSKTTGVSNEIELSPVTFSLAQNYPNPFNPSTLLSYTIPKENKVTVEVYNLLGQKVATVLNEYQQAGKHSVEFRADKLTSGIYIYRVIYGSQELTRKMILLK